MSGHERFKDFMQEIFANEAEYNAFLEQSQKPLKKSIKVNYHKVSQEDFFKYAKAFKRTLTNPWFLGDESDIFYIDREDLTVALGNTFFHQSGFFYIQEVAAGTPVHFLDLQEWDIVLDVSASPGGKSCQIADRLLQISSKNPWLVVSNDVSSQRLLWLAHNLNRMWMYNSVLSNFNGFSFGKNAPETFDKILVDAPCSWEGTGFKSDSALKFWREEEINKIAWTQFQLLVSAIKSCKVWGTVVYSTCTLNPLENEANIKKILDFFNGDVVLENVALQWKSNWIRHFDGKELLTEEQYTKVARFWPHIQKTWWFFIAKLKKIWTTHKERAIESKLFPKNPFKIDYSSGLQKKVAKYVLDEFWIELDMEWKLFVASSSQVYLCSNKFLEIKDKLQCERVWIPVFKNNDGDLRPLHCLWILFGNLSTKNVLELNEEQAQTYALWKDIEWFGDLNWYRMLKWNNYGIGIGKIVNWVLKNKYIK